MNATTKRNDLECRECGGDDFYPGKLTGNGSHVKFSIYRKATVQCSVCLSCGYVFTFVDDADLEKIRKWKSEESTDAK